MSTILGSLRTTAVFASLCVVTACTEPPPSGPTVMAFPPQGALPPQVKTFMVFLQDDQQCRVHGEIAAGWVQAGRTGPQAPIGSAGIGTVIGAAAGAAIGAAAGNPGIGAAIGGATGLAGSRVFDANKVAPHELDLQTIYNIAYSQCMTALGNTMQRPAGGRLG